MTSGSVMALKVVKFALLVSLFVMMGYHIFLSKRDSDHINFGNRCLEWMKLMEQHSEVYRQHVNVSRKADSLFLDHSVGYQLEHARDNYFAIVMRMSHWASFSLPFLIYESRVGCLIALGHSVTSLFIYNANSVLGLWAQILNVDPSVDMTAHAFTPQFVAQQNKDVWRCGFHYDIARIVLSFLLFAVLTADKIHSIKANQKQTKIKTA